MFLENTLKYGKQFGWIEVVCGSMFSGKTEELIRRLRRAEIAKMSVSIFKPNIDSRYSSGHIVSHNKIKMQSHIIHKPKEIVEKSIDDAVVGIDEAQFFEDEIVQVIEKAIAEDAKGTVAETV